MWVRQSCDEADGDVKRSGGLEAEADRINAVRSSGETGENALHKTASGGKKHRETRPADECHRCLPPSSALLLPTLRPSCIISGNRKWCLLGPDSSLIAQD